VAEFQALAGPAIVGPIKAVMTMDRRVGGEGCAGSAHAMDVGTALRAHGTYMVNDLRTHSVLIYRSA